MYFTFGSPPSFDFDLCPEAAPIQQAAACHLLHNCCIEALSRDANVCIFQNTQINTDYCKHNCKIVNLQHEKQHNHYRNGIILIQNCL